MTRKFIDDIKTEIAVTMADNVTGDISPEIMRDTLTDIMDSTINDEGAIYTLTDQAGITIGVALTKLNVFDTEIGGDGTFVKLDLLNDEIVTNVTPGFSYNVRGTVTFEGSNGKRFDLVPLVDGNTVTPFSSGVGGGNNDPISLVADFTVVSMDSNAVITLAMRAPEGEQDITILTAVLRADILPTRNPT